MDAKEREKLERACRMCREAGIEGEQLLLIRLEDVEEYPKLEQLARDILSATKCLDEMRKTLKSEVGDDDGEEQNSGEEHEDHESP